MIVDGFTIQESDKPIGKSTWSVVRSTMLPCKEKQEWLHKGVRVRCEWNDNEFHDATVLRRLDKKFKNYVELRFDSGEIECVRFCGRATPKNRPRRMYYIITQY